MGLFLYYQNINLIGGSIMKNLLNLLFVLLLSLGLVACGGNESVDSDNESEKNEGNTGSESSKEVVAAIDYPTRDIEVLVGHGAGGGTDIFTRTVTKQMKEILGVNFNVVNMEGAGGVIAKEAGANAPADGYTIIATSALPMQIATGTSTNGLNVFMPIARVQSDTFALQARPGSFDGIDDFMEQAKANPGKLTVGGTGIATADDVVTRMFKNETGIDITFVPFEGAGKMHAALLGGHINVMMEEIGPVVSAIEAGEIEPLLFYSEEKIKDFPDVPTTVEKGWKITNGVERGFLIHKDVPQEIIDILESAVKEVFESEEYKEYEKKSYLHLRDGWLGSQDYHKKLTQDIENFTNILAEIK